jgi:hypothetical protein
VTSVRFLLILLLTVALDLSTPIPPTHGTDSFEEFEESLHVQRGRRPFRLARESVAPRIAHEDRARELVQPRANVSASTRPATLPVLIRKLPPSRAESSSAPEDH